MKFDGTRVWPSLLLSSALQWNRDRKTRPSVLFDAKVAAPLPQLEREVGRLLAKSPIRDVDRSLEFLDRLHARALSRVKVIPIAPLADELRDLFGHMLDEAGLFAPSPKLTRNGDAYVQAVERRAFETLEVLLSQFDRVEAYLDEAFTAIARELLEGRLPDTLVTSHHERQDSAFTAPLVDLLHGPATLIKALHGHLFWELSPTGDLVLTGLFQSLRERLLHNLLTASGLNEEQLEKSPARARWPDPREMTPDDMVRRYLADTPFVPLLQAPMPFQLPEAAQLEHMHVLAGSGHGKTQLLQHLIVADLERHPDDVPAMVVLDSQGDMIETLKRLALFDPAVERSLADRLLIVDPSDVAFPPSLNLFDVRSERLKDYSQRDREQVLAGIIEIYDYIFGGLLGAELTQKQAMVFRFLAQLMLSIPGATIHTLRELLQDARPYMPYVAQLPPTARGFFETQFFEVGYKGTREQVLRRLYGVLQNPSFERMFAQPHNRLDLFDTLNAGGIVLVNTAKDFLKSEASSIFGRYIIALTLKAAFERAILPQASRRRTFLWIDEASEYFDDNIDNLLIQARKFNLGLVMAHQYLGQLTGALPASLMTNTSIKLVGGVSDRDARTMAAEMRTTSDFLNGITKTKTGTSFAAFVRNHTAQALKLSVPFGTAEGREKMPEERLAILRDASRARLSSLPEPSGNVPEPETPGPEDQADDGRSPAATNDDDDIFADPL